MSSFFMLGAQERIGTENHLVKLSNLLNWNKLKPLLVGLHKNEVDSQGGPIPYDPLKMFKAILLGQWHNLSDPKLEESLRVRLDFMLFTGFEIGSDLPDETTLCRFRNKLMSLGLDQKLFQEINHQLERLGLQIQSAKGAIVDATVIESAARPKLQLSEDRQEEQDESQDQAVSYEVHESVDPDARWLKKGKRCYFGYKGFIRTSDRQGFIQQVEVTSANASEVKQLPHLLAGLQDKQLYADKGYASAYNDELLKAQRIKNRIMRKATRSAPLSYWEKRLNKLISKRRYRVEQAFGTLEAEI